MREMQRVSLQRAAVLSISFPTSKIELDNFHSYKKKGQKLFIFALVKNITRKQYS
jgi:hypothetical protein